MTNLMRLTLLHSFAPYLTPQHCLVQVTLSKQFSHAKTHINKKKLKGLNSIKCEKKCHLTILLIFKKNYFNKVDKLLSLQMSLHTSLFSNELDFLIIKLIFLLEVYIKFINLIIHFYFLLKFYIIHHQYNLPQRMTWKNG